MFESIPDYRNLVLYQFLIENDKKILKEVGFSENDINRISLGFKNIFMEQNEEYLDHINSPEESVIERFLDN